MTIREKLKAECERIIAERDKWKKEFAGRLAKDVFGVFKWRAEVYLFSEYGAEIAGHWLQGIENIKEDAKLESHIRAILARDIQHLLRALHNKT